MSNEEMRAEIILSKQNSQSSQDHGKAAVLEGEKVSIVIHKSIKSSLRGSLETKFQLLSDALHVQADQSQKPKPLIQRVPFVLSDNKNFDKYYKPRSVSIGPLHHDDQKFKQSEKLKIRLAALFIKENCLGLQVKTYEKIMAEIDCLRKCYDEEETASYNDESLAWMLFVDGCAVLHYIDYAANLKLKELELKDDQMAFAGQDLFLLENQLPYKVLEILMSSSTSSKELELKKSISNCIGIIIADIRGCKLTESSTAQAPAEDTTHLLELLWKGLVGQTKPITTEGRSQHQWYSFRNVNELKAADFHNEFQITSYIVFLDSLIDQPNDVEELRKAEILCNLLGSDEKVAKLFNEIATDLVPNSAAYSEVRDKIQKHYRKKWKTWIAQWLHEHFSSPWTFLAFAGAIVALVLSIIQTFYTIHPASN